MIKYACLFVVAFALAACGSGSNNSSSPPGSSSSSASSSSSTGSAGSLTAPAGLSAIPGNGSVTLSWNAVDGAAQYHVYVASEAGIIPANIAAFQDGRRITHVSSPYTISGLQNGKAWFFVVTATNATTESNASNEIQVIPSELVSADQPTAQEVLVLELINRARANPLLEAARYGIGLNDGITGTPISPDAKPPLAFNPRLQQAARLHSQWMLDANVFSHTGANNSSVTERISAANYVLSGGWATGENIAVAGASGSTIDLTLNARQQHEGLFKSAGHRNNILSTHFREAGIGQKQGYFTFSNGRTFLSSMLTEAFARSGTSYFLTGVAYNDLNENGFYDVGEALENISIEINARYYQVYNTGAYSIPLSNGTYTMTVHGPDEDLPRQHTFVINNSNIKRDIIKSEGAVFIQ